MAVLIGTAAALGAKALLGKLAAKGAVKAVAGKSGGGGGGGLMKKLGGSLGDGMGSKAGTALGIGQKLLGAMQTKRADAMLPAMEDPMTRNFLETTQRRRRALETGTASSAERAAEQQTMTSIGKRMAKSGGPMNIGLLNQMMAQNAVQRSAGTGQEIAGLLGLEDKTVSEMAQRKADLSSLRSARMSARGAQNEASGSDNLAAGLGVPGAADMIEKKKKKKAEEDDKTTITT